MRAVIAVVIAGCALAPGVAPAAAATAAAPAHEAAGNPFRLHSAGPAGPATAKVQGRATKVEAGRAQISAAAGAGGSAVLVLAAENPSPVIPLLIGMVVGFLAVGVFSLVRRHRDDRALPSAGAATGPRRTASAGRDPETEPQPVEGDRPAAVYVSAPAPEPDAVAAMGPPDGAEQCRIIWCPDDSGSQFRAVGTNRAGRRYVAARSPTVPDSRPPLRQPETLAAFEALVERLHKRGWSPDPSRPLNGSPWYAQSFQRLRPPPQHQHAAAHHAGGRR